MHTSFSFPHFLHQASWKVHYINHSDRHWFINQSACHLDYWEVIHILLPSLSTHVQAHSSSMHAPLFASNMLGPNHLLISNNYLFQVHSFHSLSLNIAIQSHPQLMHHYLEINSVILLYRNDIVVMKRRFYPNMKRHRDLNFKLDTESIIQLQQVSHTFQTVMIVIAILNEDKSSVVCVILKIRSLCLSAVERSSNCLYGWSAKFHISSGSLKFSHLKVYHNNWECWSAESWKILHAITLCFAPKQIYALFCCTKCVLHINVIHNQWVSVSVIYILSKPVLWGFLGILSPASFSFSTYIFEGCTGVRSVTVNVRCICCTYLQRASFFAQFMVSLNGWVATFCSFISQT